MDINNWFDLLINGLFISAVVVIGIPSSLYLLGKGYKGYKRHRFEKLPANFLAAPGLGTYSIEVAFYGIFLLSFSIWCLFFDNGGQLIIFTNEAKAFLFRYYL